MSQFVPTVFLDRDGTINIDTGYISDASKLSLIPGAAKAIAKLKESGFRVVVVSNQSGIGRGLITLEQLESVNNKLVELLLEEDSQAQIDLILFCPHTPDAGCNCRKPLGGMVAELLKDLSDEPSSIILGDIITSGDWKDYAWVVGDKVSDVGLGDTLGLNSSHQFLVMTGNGQSELKKLGSRDSLPRVSDSISEAARDIINEVNILFSQ